MFALPRGLVGLVMATVSLSFASVAGGQDRPATRPTNPQSAQATAPAPGAATGNAAQAPPGKNVPAPRTAQQPQSGTGQAPAGPPPQAPAATSAQAPARAAAPAPRAPVSTQAQPPSATVHVRAPANQPVPPAQQQDPHPELSPAEQAELDNRLAMWERESDKVKTLTVNFTMWEYDAVFGAPAAPGQPPKAKRECKGEIHFAAPDKGSYTMTSGGEDRWMCDGKAIFEFDHKQRTLKEYRLPKELQGKAITNGPLPFVFGAKAETMKQRYWMRIITPPTEKNQVWLEAWPRWQQDAANFHHVQVILDLKTMLPVAIRLYDPNPANHKVYLFSGATVNGAWDQIKEFFKGPRTPVGWKHVVEDPPAEALPSDRPPPQPTVDNRTRPAGTQPPQAPTADSRNKTAAPPAQPPAKVR